MTFRQAVADEAIRARRLDEARTDLEFAIRLALWESAHERRVALTPRKEPTP